MRKEKPYVVNGENVSLEEYRKTKIDQFVVRVPKGRKEEITAHAKEQGDSLNGFVNKAIDEKIERDKNTNQSIEEQHENS